MPYLEKKQEIFASITLIFDILNNTLALPKWNIVVDGVAELTPERYFVKTSIGDMMSTRLETITDDRITIKLEGSFIEKIGYKLIPMENSTEVIVWSEFPNEINREKLDLLVGLFLKSLKKYAEYLQGGGNPEKYIKN